MTNIKIDKKGRTCYIYTRVSTDIQVEGYSLEAQEEECRRLAAAYSMRVANVYSDEGKSGKNTDGRPEFKKMLRDIGSNKDGATFILVYKLSRFGRNAADILTNLEFLKKHGAYLWSTNDSIDNSTNNGQFMITIFSAMAEMERINILEQTQAGRNQKAKNGKWNGGQPPIGYTLDKEKSTLIVNKQEAKIVKEVFKQFLNGMSYNEIAKHLNKKFKKPIRQKNDNPLFAAHNVKRILHDQTYIGMITYGKTCSITKLNEKSNKDETKRVKQTDPNKIIVTPGNFPHIIDDKTWEQAQKRLELNSRKSTYVRDVPDQHTYPLTGLIICPECGRRLDGHPNRGKISKKTGLKSADTYCYCCKNNGTTARGHEQCTFSRHLNEEKLCDEIVAIIERISHNETFLNIIAKEINSAVDVSEYEAEKSEYEKNLRIANSNLRQRTYDVDHLDPEEKFYDAKRKDLDARIDDLYAEISNAEYNIKVVNSKIDAVYKAKLNEKSIYHILANFNKFYIPLNAEQKKTCLHILIESIELQNYDDARIDYSKVIKNIKFRFTLNANNSDDLFTYLPNSDPGETVCLLSKLNTKQHI